MGRTFPFLMRASRTSTRLIAGLLYLQHTFALSDEDVVWSWVEKPYWVRRETGKAQVVRVHCDEGVANHIGPEPCVAIREGVREASVGEHAGQPWSHEMVYFPDADVLQYAEGNTYERVIASARRSGVVGEPGHAWTRFAREPGDLSAGQPQYRAGPHREGEEPNPMMYGREKSDSAIVAKKPANKVGTPAAERAEPRAGAEGNAGQQRTRRAQNPTRTGPALASSIARSRSRAASCGSWQSPSAILTAQVWYAPSQRRK